MTPVQQSFADAPLEAQTRVTDRDTSRAGAKEPRLNAQARTVLDSLRTDGPATAGELERRTLIAQYKVSARLAVLRKRGLARKTGCVLIAPSGRAQEEWEAV